MDVNSTPVDSRAFERLRLVSTSWGALLAAVAGYYAGSLGAGLALAGVLVVMIRRREVRQRLSVSSVEVGAVCGWLGAPMVSTGSMDWARAALLGTGAFGLLGLGLVRDRRRRWPMFDVRSPAFAACLMLIGVVEHAPVSAGTIHASEWLVLCGWVLAILLALVTEGFHPSGPVSGEPLSRANVVGRGGVGRNALAAGIATGTDFLVFHALLALMPAPGATFVGCVVGGFVNFAINWRWAFDATGSLRGAAIRYLWVSGASAVLNATTVALALMDPAVPPVVAWLVARGLGFLGWNYPMQREHVFRHGRVG